MKIFQLKDLDNYDVVSLFKNNPVVIPTETVYGLAARIDNEDALKSIYSIKGRPSDNPLIVHIASIEMIENLIDEEIPYEYKILMEKFWPGPLTLLFKAKDNVSRIVTGNSQFVTIRMPKNQKLRELISKLNCPLAAPSANTSGRPSPTLIDHVINDLGDKVSFYIDDGPCDIGLESTIFGILNSGDIKKYLLLRPGGISKEQIEESIGKIVEIKTKVSDDNTTICPGQKYKHYAPSHHVYLFKGENWQENMSRIYKNLISNSTIKSSDVKIGILNRNTVNYPVEFTESFELGSTLTEISKNLFSGLRYLDQNCDVIFMVEVELEDEGLAIMDRIEKAATYIIE